MQRIGDSLAGRRVLITQADEFMGPALCRAFSAYGARVIADPRALTTAQAVVMGSATGLRGLRRTSTYSAARGAQISYVRAVGVELAPHNVQVNLIAQNFVDNPTYFPPEIQALDAFKARLAREVPVGRLATPEEDAQFAVFLASGEINFFVGQSIAFSGGWVT